MTKRYILVTEEDYKQAIVFSRMVLEGKFELKGDALPLMYKAQAWFANHVAAMKNAQPFPEQQATLATSVAEPEQPATEKAETAIETPKPAQRNTKFKKGR